jgi:hypothetical protein
VTRIIVLTLGALVTVAGLLAAIFVGPGNRVGLGSTELTTETAAMTTPASALNLVGPTLHVTATATDGEVFLGVGHEMDVDAYVAGFAHDEIVPEGESPLEPPTRDADFPWQPALEPVDGPAEPPSAPPDSRDWWVASVSGSGEQTISVELGDIPLRTVVMRPDGTAPVAADIEFELEIDNLFTTALLAIGVGLGLTMLGILTLRRRRVRRARAGNRARSEAVHL